MTAQRLLEMSDQLFQYQVAKIVAIGVVQRFEIIDIDGDEGDEIEIEGYITAVAADSFDFNGQTILFSGLEVEGNVDLATLLTVGMMVELEGYIDANGDFVAEEIEIEEAGDLDAEGTVTNKTESSVTVLLTDGITEMTFTVNNDTIMLDEQDEGVTPLHYFSLSDVLIGDYLDIDYYLDEASGLNIATKVKRDDHPTP